MLAALVKDNLILEQDLQVTGPDVAKWAIEAAQGKPLPAWVYRHGEGTPTVWALPKDEATAREWFKKESQ